MKRLITIILIVSTTLVGSFWAVRSHHLVINSNKAINATPPTIATSPTVPARSPLTLMFVGDVMLDRSVWLKMQALGNDYPFAKLSDLWAGSDRVIANLEGPITDRGTHAIPGGVLIFKFEPLVAPLLRSVGFDLVSLANNHTFNQGSVGLSDSQTNLIANGIISFGQPRSVATQDVAIVDVKGWKLALIGWNTIEVANDHQAELLDLIRSLDKTVDRVIVMPHWGTEYQPQTTGQIAAAHALIDAGADLIIGAHPHTVQGIETYRDRLVVYSLGNFIFDQYWSEPTQQGLAVQLTLTDQAVAAKFIPIDLHDSQPRAAGATMATEVIDRLLKASAALNSELINQVKSARQLTVAW